MMHTVTTVLLLLAKRRLATSWRSIITDETSVLLPLHISYVFEAVNIKALAAVGEVLRHVHVLLQ